MTFVTHCNIFCVLNHILTQILKLVNLTTHNWLDNMWGNFLVKVVLDSLKTI